MTPARRYLLSFAGVFLALGALYALAFIYQLGAPVAAEYWVPEAKIVKEYAARRIAGPKIVIVGGSNALYGFDSALIERELRLGTVNLALHGSLSLDYLFDYADSVLIPGDVVILSLEYGYYESANPGPSWFSSNIMAWDPGYVGRLPLGERVAFALSASSARVLDGVIAKMYERRLRQVRGRVVRAPSVVIAEATEVWKARTYRAPAAHPTFRSMDEHGDFRNNAGAFFTHDMSSDSVGRFTYSPEPWERLRRFAETCRRRDIRVYVSWPALPARLGRNAVSVESYLGEIRDRVAGLGIPALGDPTEFLLDQRYFFDTVYHLNEEGQALRTTRLLPHLKARR